MVLSVEATVVSRWSSATITASRRLDRLPAAACDAVGPVDGGDYRNLLLSRLFSRHIRSCGSDSDGRLWLVGNLYRQQRPHEIYCVAHTVLEARGTKHERFSIDFSTETFTHVEQQLALIRRRFGRAADVLLGFTTRIRFCPRCSTAWRHVRPAAASTCTLTSSFFSVRDQRFHAAIVEVHRTLWKSCWASRPGKI